MLHEYPGEQYRHRGTSIIQTRREPRELQQTAQRNCCPLVGVWLPLVTLGGYQGINLHILIQFYTNGSLYVKQSVLISDIHVHVYGIWSYVSFQLLYIVMTTASVVDRGIKLQSGQTKDY